MSSEVNGSSELAGYRAQVRCVLDKQQLCPLLPGLGTSVPMELTVLLGRQEECPESREDARMKELAAGSEAGRPGL